MRRPRLQFAELHLAEGAAPQEFVFALPRAEHIAVKHLAQSACFLFAGLDKNVDGNTLHNV
ncbi:MAG: hypothetical protein OXE47_01110, partial [Gammaproteobacteria bacterium]|nr:hypothetical protein [Gammaproteobacteria bacterium]